MIPQPIGDVRCPYCFQEFENADGVSAGDQLADHLTDVHDHFSIDADDTCPLCAEEFQAEEIETGGRNAVEQQRRRKQAAKEQLIDHMSTVHGGVYGRALKIGLAGGR